MSTLATRAWGLAAALLSSLLLVAAPASAAAPDPVAACDGTAFTATTVAGRAAVSCDDGWVRGWQRLTIADARVDRGTSGGATLTFAVTRPEAGNPVAISYATADGSARAGTDYTAASGTLVLEADETSGTISVPVVSSARAGSDLQLSLGLSDPSGVALFERDHATGTIVNRAMNLSWETNPDADYICDGGFYSVPTRPDGTRAVTCLGRTYTPVVSAWLVDPRAGLATFTIDRDPRYSDGSDYGTYYIAWRTVDGSLRAGVDYTATSGTVALRSGQHTLTLAVPIGAGARTGGTIGIELTTDRPGTTIGVADPVARVVNPVSGTATVRPLAATVTDVPRVGRTLTGPAGAAGWAWWRCDTAGACQPIVGASAQSYTTTPLDLGFTLRVRATASDPAGGTQISDTVASGPVRVAAPAAPAIDAGPGAGTVVRSPAAAFAFSGREADGAYECALDGAAFTACDATLQFTTLGSGPHRLSVRQRTVDGVASAATTRAWAVAVAPDGAAACDGTAFTTTVVSGRDVVACDDGAVRDWQRVAIADAHVTRSNTAGTTLRFTVTRPEAGSPVFLRYRTIAGTAAAGSDFTAADDVLVLEADQTSATIDVAVPADVAGRDDRALRVQLSDEQGGVVEFARASATGTLRNRTTPTSIDGDNACNGGLYDVVVVDGWRTIDCLGGVNDHLTVSAGAITVDPRAGSATFELRRPAYGGPVGIAYETVDGSARAGVDYVATNGTLVMNGEQRVARVTVPLLDPPGAGADRTFTLRLSAAAPLQTLALTDGSATIRRFAPVIAGTPRVGQPLSGAAPAAATRQWQRCDALGACWNLGGATTAAYPPVAADLGRTLRVRATAAGDAGETLTAETPRTAVVRDVVAAPSIAAGPSGVVTDRTAQFSFTGREADAIGYECALDGAAYAACGDADGAVSFSGLASGEHAVSVRQRTVDGLASSAASRAWTVAAAPDGAAACDGTPFTAGTVEGRPAIVCDDHGIRDWQRVTVRDARVARGTAGGATLRFAVTRPEAGSPLSLRARTVAGTAVAGSDFTPLDTVVVLEADQTTATVAVPVTSSAAAVDDLTLQLALGDEHGAGIEFARARATGVIANANETANRIDAETACDGGLYDIVIVDRLPNPRCLNVTNWPFQTVLASSPTVDPAAGVAVFELERRAPGGRAWFAWETADGSARAGVDYVASSGTVRMADGQTRRRVVVPLLDAPGTDGDRSFTLHLTAGHASMTGFGGSDGTATIRRFTPAIAGTPRVGQPLTGAVPGAATRQWQHCDARDACWDAAGAMSADHVPTTEEIGRRLRVRATVTGDAGETITAATPLTAPVRGLVAAPTLAGGPAEASATDATTATFALSGKEVDASWECALDGAAFAACDADGDGSVTVDGLALGAHSFAIRQRTVDSLDSAAATRTWTVVAPEPRTPDPDGRTPDPGTPAPQPRGPAPDQPGTPPGPTPPGDGGPPSPPGTRPAAPKPRVRGVRQQNRSVTRAAAGVTNIVLHCSRRCALSAPLTISARDARRLGLRSTRIGVARGSTAEAGLVRLRVRLSATAKARLLANPTLLRVVALVPNPAAGDAVRVSFGLKPAVRR